MVTPYQVALYFTDTDIYIFFVQYSSRGRLTLYGLEIPNTHIFLT